MHTYATVAALEDYLRDSGSQDLGQGNDALYLKALEAGSRRIDGFCARSSALPAGTWTGFGPRTGTNRYDAKGLDHLRLDDDFVSISGAGITLADTTGGTPVTLVADTDYYLEPYSGPPYRTIQLTGLGIGPAWSRRGWSVTGTWSGPGYAQLATLATVASGLSLDAAATTFVLSASPDFSLSPGHELLIGTEQLYLTALNGTNATVLRGQNGTTAAVHADGSAISVYTYHPDVVDATLQIAKRRLSSRDAGISGAMGGAELPTTVQQETEWRVLLSTVGDLRLISIG